MIFNIIVSLIILAIYIGFGFLLFRIVKVLLKSK
ncbi:hypothetical protein BN1002_02050 [Bacillus sp. B-jedd]|nr:hypothetical protein BN1002_02050 [Bacillus sp. B-jedd]